MVVRPARTMELKFSDMIHENQESADSFLSHFPLKTQTKMLEQAASDFMYWNNAATLENLVWILKKGIDVNAPLPSGESLIHHMFSVVSDKLAAEKTLEILIEFGADIECKTVESKLNDMFSITNKEGQTPFLMCAKFGSFLGAQVLLEKGADIGARNNQGLGFLDIFQANMDKLSHGDEAGELLKWFVATDEGEKQMQELMKNTQSRLAFMEFHPDFTSSWLADHEKNSLNTELPNTDNPKSGLRL